MRGADMQFTPTEFDTASDKEKFRQQFIRFVRSDFSRAKFPKWFYTRLSMTFGHIAHYNIHGFFDEFFASTADKLRFLEQTVQWPCYGDPAYTYSDVERVLRRWVVDEKLVETYTAKLAEETERQERRQLAHLQAKYPD
jgi:hypothetical protein